MLARKCDRCGTLYEMYQECESTKRSNAIILIDRDKENKYWKREDYDLCPNCAKALCEWLEDADEED